MAESLQEEPLQGGAGALVGEEGSATGEDAESIPANCFSNIQTKKFWSPLLASTCRLCPSMDLIVLGMQTQSDPSHASSLSLHRTVSWQKLSTLTNFGGGSNDTDECTGVTHVAWSPDGRNFAVSLPHGDVVLYHVEAMVSSVPSMSGDSSAGEQGLICVVPVAKAGIVGLAWAHVGRKHPSWHFNDAEEEEELSWRFVPFENYFDN